MNIYNGPLRITPESWALAGAVQAYAFQNRKTLRQTRNRISTGTKPPGEDPGHCLAIPVGYNAVYMIEQDEIGWCQHIALYVTQPKMDPSPGAAARILELFGIKAATPKGVLQEAVRIWPENVSTTTVARNFLYKIKDFAAMQKRMEELLQVAPKSEQAE